MKQIQLILIVFLFLTACSSFDLSNNKSSTITGTTDVPMNKKGTTFSPFVTISGGIYTGTASATITKVAGDVTTIKFNATLPANQPLLSGIKSKYKDANGNLDCEGTFKITDKGILDYNNADHEPFVLVKFDAKVGDKYTFTKSDGTVITREVVRKSTDDDWGWNFMMIKTIDVEQDSRIPGVKKLIYITNHKFGIVAVQVVLEDGTISQVDLYPSAYLSN
jgi:hypothetical protein